VVQVLGSSNVTFVGCAFTDNQVVLAPSPLPPVNRPPGLTLPPALHPPGVGVGVGVGGLANLTLTLPPTTRPFTLPPTPPLDERLDGGGALYVAGEGGRDVT
jgi:hypothetical protein